MCPTLITVKNQLISADFNQPIFDFPHNLLILDQNHNIGHFSHSILVTQPNSAIGIEKFQKLWNFSEFLESAHTYLKLGCFWQLGHFPHSILSTEFDSDIRIDIEKFENWKKNHMVHTYILTETLSHKDCKKLFGFQILTFATFYYIKCTQMYTFQVTYSRQRKLMFKNISHSIHNEMVDSNFPYM